MKVISSTHSTYLEFSHAKSGLAVAAGCGAVLANIKSIYAFQTSLLKFTQESCAHTSLLQVNCFLCHEYTRTSTRAVNGPL